MAHRFRAHTAGVPARRVMCQGCGKRAFATEAQARQDLAYNRTVGGRGEEVPLRVYPCPRGNGYHLTKQQKA